MEEGNCFVCGDKLWSLESRWYDNEGHQFCSYWNRKSLSCKVVVEKCKETDKLCIYWEGKLYYVNYYTDG